MRKSKDDEEALAPGEPEPQPEPEPEGPKGMVRVTSGLKSPVRPDGGNIVAFWESDPDHPNGEVFIAGREVVLAAETPGVLGALREGRLKRA